jgi:hypothetical protein
MSDVVVSVSDSVTDVSVVDNTVLVAVTESDVQVSVSESARQSEDIVYTIVGGSTGTQPTFDGDPLFSGSFARTGALVHFQIQVEFDNITSFGTGQYYLDLPFTSKYNYQFSAGCLHDVSNGREYPIFGHVSAGEKRVYLQSLDNQGSSTFQVDFTSTNPITLSTADNFHVSGMFITSDAI